MAALYAVLQTKVRHMTGRTLQDYILMFPIIPQCAGHAIENMIKRGEVIQMPKEMTHLSLFSGI